MSRTSLGIPGEMYGIVAPSVQVGASVWGGGRICAWLTKCVGDNMEILEKFWEILSDFYTLVAEFMLFIIF